MAGEKNEERSRGRGIRKRFLIMEDKVFTESGRKHIPS